VILPLDEFELEHVAPTKAKCDLLQADIDTAEAALKAAAATTPYDDGAAAEIQARLAELRLDHQRWERRLNYLGTRRNAQSGGKVELP
jgi:predicted negative regulator of RcsB-dependent stress response